MSDILNVPVSVNAAGTWSSQRADHADLLMQSGMDPDDAQMVAAATIPWLSNATGTYAQFDALRAARATFTTLTDPSTRTGDELIAAARAGLRAMIDTAENIGLDEYAQFLRGALGRTVTT